MSRRAQLLGHIIVFIIGLIVVAMVLLLGYTILSNMREKSCDVQRVQFSTQLATMIDTNRGYGTIKQVQLKVPCDTTHVCFMDRRAIDAFPQDPPTDWEWINAPPDDNMKDLMEASARAGDSTNIFTVQKATYIEPVSRFSGVGAPIEVVRSTDTKPQGTCIEARQGILRLELRGTGTAVRVGKP